MRWRASAEGQKKRPSVGAYWNRGVGRVTMPCTTCTFRLNSFWLSSIGLSPEFKWPGDKVTIVNVGENIGRLVIPACVRQAGRQVGKQQGGKKGWHWAPNYLGNAAKFLVFFFFFQVPTDRKQKRRKKRRRSSQLVLLLFTGSREHR